MFTAVYPKRNNKMLLGLLTTGQFPLAILRYYINSFFSLN